MIFNVFTKLVAVLLLMFSTACVTNSDLGNKSTEISEAESALVFYGPGLEGGFRRIISGLTDNRARQTFGIYGPKKGKTPYANIVLLDVSASNYYFKKQSIEKTVKIWAGDKNDPPIIIEEGFTINKLGKALYATYKEADEMCLAFIQNYGSNESAQLEGNRKITGHYCDRRTSSFTHMEATHILKMLGDRNVAYPQAPKNWASAGANLGTNTKTNTKITNVNSMSFLLAFKWGDLSPIEDVDIIFSKSQTSDQKPSSTFEFENKILGHCSGTMQFHQHEFEKSPFKILGKWEMQCTDQKASGTFLMDQESVKRGLLSMKIENIKNINEIELGGGKGISSNYKTVVLTVTSKDQNLIDRVRKAINKATSPKDALISPSNALDPKSTAIDELLAVKLSRPWTVSLDWNEVSEFIDLPIHLVLKDDDLIGTFEFAHYRVGDCRGEGKIPHYRKYHTASELMGSWKIICNDTTAKGNITVRSKDGSGVGHDSKNRTIIVSLSAS